MLTLLKRWASHLPVDMQLALKRAWCTFQLRLGLFKHDEPEFKKLADWVSEGDCVIDVGANIGVFAAALSELVGPEGHVFAFEPVPQSFHLLAYNARRFAHRNVTLLNAAASDAPELVSMAIPAFASGLRNFYRAHIVDSSTENRIFAMPVDALRIPGRLSFCKIDVEGHELKVLQGMEQTLKQHGPILVVEGDDESVREYLRSLGYNGHKMVRSPNTVFTFASS